MTEESTSKRVTTLLENHLRTMRMLSVRVRALERILESTQPDFRERYPKLVATLESQKSQPVAAQEWSEFDELILLLTGLLEGKN